MGRPTRRPPYLSLEPLLAWRQGPFPYPWERRFGRRAPLRLEIGFGYGDYLVSWALREPEADIVGVEADWLAVRRALRKAALAGVRNVALLWGDARAVVNLLFEEESLDHVTALFPYPWPKVRHAKHRLFSKGFLALLGSRLRRGGEVGIVTDQEAYAQWILQQCRGTGLEGRAEPVPPGFSTKYERKWTALGQGRFTRVILAKKAPGPAIHRREVTSVKVRTVPQFDPRRMEKMTVCGEARVIFKDTLFDPQKERAMVRVLVQEEFLAQDIWLEVARRGEGWRIRPAKGCSTIPSRGVQWAIDVLWERLGGLRKEPRRQKA